MFNKQRKQYLNHYSLSPVLTARALNIDRYQANRSMMRYLYSLFTEANIPPIDQSHSQSMKKGDCLGCQTYFQHNEKLNLEDMVIEHKNYSLPMREPKMKWTILKTIVAFLNCKGGTIYLGVQDSTGQAQGLLLQRKEMDNFRLEVKQLIEKIVPKVDLSHKEQVVIHYVPIFQGKEFIGKYIVKIIVQQGDPSRTYAFSEKIKLENPNGKTDEIDNFIAFFRHNMGGIDRMNGVKLMEEIYKRAKDPNPIATTFHEGCNPDPPSLVLEIKKINFSNIKPQERSSLEEIFIEQLGVLGVEYDIQYNEEKKLISIVIEQSEELEKANEYVSQHLGFFNEALKIFNFKNRGKVINAFHYQNIGRETERPDRQNKKKEERDKEEKKEQKHLRKQEEKSERRGEQQEEVEKVRSPKQKFDKMEEKLIESPVKGRNGPQQNFPRRFGLTFTHINTKAAGDLQKFLANTVEKVLSKQFAVYKNTIEVFFRSQEDLYKYCNKVTKHYRALEPYGFNGDIKVGKNSGMVMIYNYNASTRNELEAYLQAVIGGDLKEIGFGKEGKKHFLGCRMKDKAKACEWLDLLLADKQVKKYRIPGSEHGSAAKMKFHLELDGIE